MRRIRDFYIWLIEEADTKQFIIGSMLWCVCLADVLIFAFFVFIILKDFGVL